MTYVRQGLSPVTAVESAARVGDWLADEPGRPVETVTSVVAPFARSRLPALRR